MLRNFSEGLFSQISGDPAKGTIQGKYADKFVDIKNDWKLPRVWSSAKAYNCLVIKFPTFPP
jgi:hypothetical protein